MTSPAGTKNGRMSDHPDKLLWYVSGALNPDEALHVETHLRDCVECRGVASTLEAWKTSVLRRPTPGLHPEPEELDDYLRFPPKERRAERATIEAHLGGCAACRDDLAALRRTYEGAASEVGPMTATRRSDTERVETIRGWVLAAALVAVLIAPAAWFWMSGREDVPVLVPALRAAVIGPVLAGKGPWRTSLVPPAEASPGLYEMRVERLDGTLVEPMDRLDLLEGEDRIPIEVPVLPGPASYRIVMVPSGEDASAAHFYPFRVEPGT